MSHSPLPCRGSLAARAYGATHPCGKATSADAAIRVRVLVDFLEDSARGPHHSHLTTALAARYLTLRYGAFPGPDDVPFLDLIALEDPLAHTALRSGYFAAPSLATLSLGYLVVRSPAPKPSST